MYFSGPQLVFLVITKGQSLFLLLHEYRIQQMDTGELSKPCEPQWLLLTCVSLLSWARSPRPQRDGSVAAADNGQSCWLWSLDLARTQPGTAGGADSPGHVTTAFVSPQFLTVVLSALKGNHSLLTLAEMKITHRCTKCPQRGISAVPKLTHSQRNNFFCETFPREGVTKAAFE